MRIFTLILSLMLASLISPLATAVENNHLSPWSTVDNVTVSTQYTNINQCSNALWKAENNSSSRVWVTVVNKVFTCKNGANESQPDSQIGPDYLNPGDMWTSQVDTCVCDGKGGIDLVSASLNIL
jgi:hypothetical protein